MTVRERTLSRLFGISDADAVGFETAQTITPRTFAARLAEPAPGEAETLAAPGARGQAGPEAPEPTLLPHISLASAEGASTGGPARVADLEIQGVLGEGGMGRVLLARQRSLRREVAVKIVRPDVADAALVEGLLGEALVTGALEHPSVVPIHALGRDDDGRPVLVMKRVEGVVWSDLIAAPRHPAWARIDPASDDHLTAHLGILMQVCNAVHFAHSRGVLHRDIKPDNVMIGEFGEVYVLDWGIATALDPLGAARPAGPLVGTPAYMAPEMASDERVLDVRTDVHLLGGALHTVLTGKPRHEGETLLEVLLAAAESRPYAYPADVPAELAAISNKATSARREERHPTALALRVAIAEHLRHRGSIALSDEARVLLEELRALRISAAASGRDLDLGAQHRLITECRFGFLQALRAWKDNRAAESGLAACLEVAIDHELSQKNAEGARVLIAELPRPDAELERRLLALDDELAGARQREVRLRAMERDADPSIGAGARLVGLVAISLVGAVLSFVAHLRGVQALTHRDLVFFTGLTLATAALVFAIARRRLLGTAHARKLAGLLLAWLTMQLGCRLLGAMQGTPVPALLAADLWIMAGVSTIGALTAIPRGGWAVPVFIAAAVLAATHPDLAGAAFTASTMVGAAILVWVTRGA
jgi:serine/threonine-protein kinase